MTIIKKYWVYILFAFSVIVFLVTRFKQRTTDDESSFQLKTIKAGTGFGYEIKKNNLNFIKQTVIPAVEGDKIFITEAEAEKTGKLVIYKLEHDQMPSISIQELDSMHITR